MKNRPFLDRHGFGTKEAVPLRLGFWYSEYLKRNLIVHDYELCRKIRIAAGNIHAELARNISFDKETDILKVVIRESILKELGFDEKLCIERELGSLVDIIGESKDDLSFLSELTKKFGHYSHKLISPLDMSDVIRYINNGGDTANIEADIFASFLDSSKYKVDVHPSRNEMDISSCMLNISVDITSDDFDFLDIINEISFHIASRRHLLKTLGGNITLSQPELSEVTRKHVPVCMNIIKHSNDYGRAIGLWCWDKLVFVSSKNNFIYSQNAHTPVPNALILPFSRESDWNITDRELLFMLIGEGFLKNFSRKSSPALCENEKRSCLYDAGGQKGGGSLDRACKYFPSCLRRLNGLIKNANLCIEKKQIITSV